MTDIQTLTDQIKAVINAQPDLKAKVALINQLRAAIAEASPLREPVDLIQWVDAECIQANNYNPNKVATPEMNLLYESIKQDGYTQPIVAYKMGDEQYEIVDGFHRNRVGKEFDDIKKRVHGYLPVVLINKPLDERIGSTIRHNRARGTHQIRAMSDIVVDLVKDGWSDEKIGQNLGMSRDEVLRLKQISGLKEMFANHVFSKSWEDFETRHYPAEKGIVGKTVARAPKRKAP